MNAKQWMGLFVALPISILLAGTASAATMNYGDKMGNSLTYRNITESNSGPDLLFTEPRVVGDSLVFDPDSFDSEVNPGPGADLTDSELTTRIQAKPGFHFDAISVQERGDFTLTGTPGSFASASVGAAFFVRVMELNGVAVTRGPSVRRRMTFSPGNGNYSLPGDMGNAIPFLGQVTVDLSPAALGLAPDQRVTAVRLTFDNSLTTAAGSNAAAFIKKKDINGIIIIPRVPEPTSAALCLVGLGLIACRRNAGMKACSTRA